MASLAIKNRPFLDCKSGDREPTNDIALNDELSIMHHP